MGTTLFSLTKLKFKDYGPLYILRHNQNWPLVQLAETSPTIYLGLRAKITLTDFSSHFRMDNVMTYSNKPS